MRLVNKTDVGQRRVYDIEVEDVHNFYANGVNVHNCATDGGVSVIKDDGTVVDLTYTASVSNEAGGVWFPASGGIAWQSRSASGGYVYTLVENEIPTADKSTASDALYANFGQKNFAGNDLVTLGISQPTEFVDGALGSPSGFTRIDENPVAPANGMVAYTTSTYNTGWMNGDIKGAFLSDTDDTDLVGSGELVTNGTFDTDISGWTDDSTGTGSISWNSSGYLQLNSTDSNNRAIAKQSFATEVGKVYTFTFEQVAGTEIALRLGTTDTGSQYYNHPDDAVGVYAATFTATATTLYITIYGPQSASNTQVDNVSVRLSEEDRSVNGKGLQVFGTVTKNPVATGADLVAYSGFTASNYLEQPYNSDLDFGTGDFCVMGWVKTTDTDGYILERGDVTRSGPFFYLYQNANFVQMGGTGGGFDTGDVGIASGTWRHFCIARSSGVRSWYIDGDLKTSAANTSDYTNTNAVLRLAHRITDGASAQSGSLALLRISATAPTAEQIRRIYNDEKVLFQENAQATLYGSSDAVTALAYDDSTEILSVGTSAGRSDFQGLRRVNNTTNAVGAAISASNGMIVEE